MKNLKQIALGLMIGALAISVSAFTNASPASSSKFTTYYYTLNTDDANYTRFGTSKPSEAPCVTEGVYHCVVGFAADQGPAISASSIPAQTYDSGNVGIWDN